jgi:hypothetical protein
VSGQYAASSGGEGGTRPLQSKNNEVRYKKNSESSIPEPCSTRYKQKKKAVGFFRLEKSTACLPSERKLSNLSHVPLGHVYKLLKPTHSFRITLYNERRCNKYFHQPCIKHLCHVTHTIIGNIFLGNFNVRFVKFRIQ